MSQPCKRVAIVGAGISGLSAAYYIQTFCQEKGISVHISIIEQSEQLGGKIRTLHRDGCVIEQGPDSFLARKLPMLELARELNLEDELVATNPQARKTYILHNRKLHQMPAGLMLGIPTQIMPFLRTGLISPMGKARAALDLILPRKTGKGDEALGGFLSRRLGSEVLEHIAEPLLAGIYAGDTKELSLASTFPQFQAFELESRSVIIGMIRSKLRSKKQQRRNNMQNVSTRPTEPVERGGQVPLSQLANKSMFLTFKNGLSTLVNSLVAHLSEATIQTGVSVTNISSNDGQYNLKLSDGCEELFDSVVLAVPNYAAVQMLPHLAAAHSLINIPYVSVANVVMAFRKSELTLSEDGSGFLVPRGEGLTITACTWTSVKWLHTAPKGTVLVRCYIGRAGATESVTLTDEQLTELVKVDLKDVMGIEVEPLFVEVTRWNDSMPQYPVGHLEQLKEFRHILTDSMPGVYVTGSGYQGVGLPDCIGQARQCAEQVVENLLIKS